MLPVEQKGKAQQLAVEIPVVLQAKAFVAGQLVGGDGDEAGVAVVHLRAQFAHGQCAGLEPMNAALFGPGFGACPVFMGRALDAEVIVRLQGRVFGGLCVGRRPASPAAGLRA